VTSTAISAATPAIVCTTQFLAQRIHAALPQTQCTRCGYPDCAAYASAIATDGAPINQCPPGGDEGVQRLAAITRQPALPLNPANGLEAPRSVAVIDEAWCIGCTLCLPACPTDAILGSNKMMHTVIEPHCTGCELCIAVCPVDCISLENVTGERTGWAAWSQSDADAALMRYVFHSSSRPDSLAKTDKLLKTTPSADDGNTDASAAQTKREVIAQAIAKARASRQTG
jgi:Na+-translocating ferredoxin:NAD+ oxidoreductase subunit B